MKQMRSLMIAIAILLSPLAYAQQATYQYKEELENFKKLPEYEIIFNEDADPLLRALNRDIENYKELTLLQRIARFEILALDTIVVTADTMPKLYAYIDGMCKEIGIKTPTIFITVEKGFLNAMALKLLMSTGAIVLGQKILKETNDRELEAVIAHEIGHIKHNHVNKMLGLLIPSAVAIQAAKYYFFNRFNLLPKSNKYLYWAADIELTMFIAGLITNFIINKKFEKEADEFAYRDMGDGEGLKEFFELLQKRELKTDEDFATTYVKLQESESKIGSSDYNSLKIDYYMAKGFNYLDKAFRWLYYNTSFGPHPSPEARIKTIQAYLDEQATNEETDIE